jgi:hypothetical protein
MTVGLPERTKASAAARQGVERQTTMQSRARVFMTVI